MNKKVVSLLLAFVMLLGMMATAVPAHADGNIKLTIKSDKSEAYPGDTIKYTVVLDPVESLSGATLTLVIPDGLTFNRCTVSKDLSDLLYQNAVEYYKEKYKNDPEFEGLDEEDIQYEAEMAAKDAYEHSFERSTKKYVMYTVVPYSSDEEIVLCTIQCTAKDLGEFELGLAEKWEVYKDVGTDKFVPQNLPVTLDTAPSKVKVVEKPIPATGISLDKSTLAMKTGDTATLTATLTPAESNTKVEWTTSDAKIATVDAGKVTAIAEGTATITAKAGDFTATCAVTVECAHAATTPHAAVESTCTVQGNDAYETCNTCGDVVKGSDKKLPLDEDNHVNTKDYAAETGTCKTPGHAAYTFCDDCDRVVSGSDAPVAGPHGAHIEKVEEKYLISAADCENAAVYCKSCELCGEAFKDEPFTYGKENGHTEVIDTAVDPTCTETGLTEGKHCSVCNKTLVKQDVVPVLGHDMQEEVHDDHLVSAADCENAAAYYKCCSRCGTASDDIFFHGDKLGHKWVDATCDAPKTCQRCSKTEGDKLGHDWAKTWSKSTEGHWHDCTRCDAVDEILPHDFGDAGDECVVCEFERDHVHRLTAVPGKDKTCTEDGNKAYYTCSGCDEWFEDAAGNVKIEDKASVVIPAGHDWKDATCEEPKTCITCNETEGEKLGHDWKDATCDAPKTCGRCGETEGEALGHDWATEWSTGEDDHWYDCSRCDAEKDKAVHDFGDAGDICVTCGYERDHVHRLTAVPGEDKTCTEDGNKAYYTCSGCDEWFEDAAGSVKIEDKESVVIPAGHDWKDATCEDPKTCEDCGETEGEALGHDYQNGTCGNCGEKDPDAQEPEKPNKPIVPNWSNIIKHWFGKWWNKDEVKCDHSYTAVVTDPTCTEKGYTTHTCDKCGDSYTDSYVNATGHHYVKGVCSDCGHKCGFSFYFDWIFHFDWWK